LQGADPSAILAAMKLLVVAALLTAACGSKPPAPTTPKAEEEAAVVLPDVPFDKLDQKQKIAFMKQKVVPEMKPVFQNHNAKDFAEFGCKTCHGDDVKDGHFDMPNPKLPKLNFKDHNSKYEKADLEWMAKEVMPTMGKILNLPLHSEENPKGFGCLGCHTMEAQ
jgi:cytochrome c553